MKEMFVLSSLPIPYKHCHCHCDAGYVPQDKPGTAGYFTPRSSALYANDCFDHADCTSRNPVMSRLNGELRSNPFRHRTARKLHVRGWHLKVPAPLLASPSMHPLPSAASPSMHLLLSAASPFTLPLPFACIPFHASSALCCIPLLPIMPPLAQVPCLPSLLFCASCSS